MKVLFAVHDEKVSSSIVKKYQREYKEIISYKNVYYFNAIIRELQRDKTYDRIVIDEELEEFTSSSYEQKDKFIFEKLDNITDEASNSKGNDIPIILICSERRMKSEEFLIKLFGIAIYNAIIGNDRSTDEVCKLINKPRSKKESKVYYKIDSEHAGYKKEKMDDVSEEEIQHILSYFKRIGKNEKKCVDGFKNIVSQYNEKQLRVIISVLPLQTKAILEEESLEYQKFVAKNKGKLGSNSVPKTKKVPGTSEKLLTDKKANSGKPIVVPSKIEKTVIKKVSLKKPNVNYSIASDDFEELDDLSETKAIQNPKVKKENIENNLKNDGADILDELEQVAQAPKKRGRGRPRKNPIPQEEENKTEKKNVERKRGRPKKDEYLDEVEEDNDKVNSNIKPKIYDEEEFEDDTTTLPGFDEIDDFEEETTLPGFNEEDDFEEETTLPGFDEEDDFEEETTLPRFDEEDDFEEETTLPGFNEEDDFEEETTLPGFDEENNFEEDTNLSGFDDEDNFEEKNVSINKYDDEREFERNNKKHPRVNKLNNTQRALEKNEKQDYDYSEYNNLLSSTKKVIAFVGTSKNGTSFIVNNIAKILSDGGIDTAILDTTQNKNAYYIYTQNDEELRRTALRSIDSLLTGAPAGIKVNNNLTVYTEPPIQESNIYNVGSILETLIKNYSAVLIDCDFSTPVEYFENAQEIYLVQSMDVLTIQPLTAFLRELKAKNIIDERKIKIVINKSVKIKGVNSKTIVGGMAYYNDPEMSFMTELFDRNSVVPIEVPFDSDVYARYLEEIIECDISTNKYPKEFQNILKDLACIVYPLLPAKKVKEKSKKGYQYSATANYTNNGFSKSVNDTLNNMKNKY